MNNDFYNFINKDWIQNNPIPNDKSKWNQFDKLSENNFSKIKKIIENLNIDNNLFILYNQFLIKDAELSKTLINSYLNKIDNFTNILDLWKYMINLSFYLNLDLPLNFNIQSNLNISENNSLYIYTGGLGLPNRDYYFKQNYKLDKDNYKDFIKEYSKLFNLTLDPEIIVLFEEKLAEKTYTNSQERDPYLINNSRTIEEINNDYSNLLFINYIFEYYNKIPNIIIVTNPNFLKNINDICSNIYLNSWKLYFKWKLILSIYSYIDFKIEETYLSFYNFKLKGEKSFEPLWMRSLQTVNILLGQEIGILYKNKYFDDKNISIVKNMFNDIKKSIKISLIENDWLCKPTKTKAILKLDKMGIKIGYPSDLGLKNYKNLKLDKNKNYLINIMNTIKYNNDLLFEMINTKRNPYLWFMNSHDINAYYSPSFNEIVIPAGILQKPFFYNDKNKHGYNFGGIGMIIGHEIIHGFDDKGKLFDENGNLNNWWNKYDIIKYNTKVQALKNQFNSYSFMNEIINTDLTIGENIADLGGLKFSLNALEKNIIMYDDITKTTIFKNFFYNYANIWASNIRKEKLKQNILIDSHSPALLRVNGVLKNIDKFYEIYNICDGDLFLSKNNRIMIW